MKKNDYYPIFNTMVLLLASTYGHAACNPNITLTAPNSRYELLNSGSEVKDKQTGLVWQRCSLSQIWDGASCTGSASQMNWPSALQTAANLGSGWRVPNIKELDSLVELACYGPSINKAIFPNVPNSRYWSSSPDLQDGYDAWSVNFNDGRVDRESGDFFVRLVRNGQ